jgi:hypothetical protein
MRLMLTFLAAAGSLDHRSKCGLCRRSLRFAGTGQHYCRRCRWEWGYKDD